MGKGLEKIFLVPRFYPEEFFSRLIGLGLCTKGQQVLDLGTGTGVLPRNLYRFGADFVGADISENQILEAKRLSREAEMNITYIVASAESVDFPPSTFDTVMACQCFIYFDQAVVLPKIHALLKPNGHFCVTWLAWLPEEDKIAETSEQLVLKHNPSWTGAGFQRPSSNEPACSSPLFEVANAVSFDIPILFTRESWHGRMLACRGIGASSLTPAEIAAFESEHLRFLETCPPCFEIRHYVTILDYVRK